MNNTFARTPTTDIKTSRPTDPIVAIFHSFLVIWHLDLSQGLMANLNYIQALFVSEHISQAMTQHLLCVSMIQQASCLPIRVTLSSPCPIWSKQFWARAAHTAHIAWPAQHISKPSNLIAIAHIQLPAIAHLQPCERLHQDIHQTCTV